MRVATETPSHTVLAQKCSRSNYHAQQRIEVNLHSLPGEDNRNYYTPGNSGPVMLMIKQMLFRARALYNAAVNAGLPNEEQQNLHRILHLAFSAMTPTMPDDLISPLW